MDRKIVTICGPYRFWDLQIEEYRRLTNLGHIVLMPAGPGMDDHDVDFYRSLHFDKIGKSDFVYIVDGDDGYVGQGTAEEIAFAKSIGVPIIRYSEEKKVL